MKSFDTSALSILLFKSSKVPLDFRTQAPITNARERMDQFVKDLSRKGEKILIPDPALSEFLVTAVFAGASIQDYLKIIQDAQHFVTKPFGVRAAVEVAERLATAIKSGDKREGQKSEPWEKLKIDRQIIAISIVEGATAIYSTDKDIHSQGTLWGIEVISPADLPVPIIQAEMFEKSTEAKGKVPEKSMKHETRQRPRPARPLSLAPLSFDQAVADILKIKPEPKAPKKKAKAKKQAKSKT
jgi:hypothetical protein